MNLPRTLIFLVSCSILAACGTPSGGGGGGGGGSDAGPGPSMEIGRTLSLGSCQNASSLTVVGEQAFVACGGDFTGNGELAIVDLGTFTVTAHVALGGAPGSVKVDGARVYLGDMLDGRVLVANTDGTMIHDATDAVVLCPSDFATDLYQFIPDVEVLGDTIFATCFSTDEVVAFRVAAGTDPGDGTKNAEILGRATGGDGLGALEPWHADDLVGLDNLAGTATHITSKPLATSANYWTTSEGPYDLRIAGDLAYVTNSGSNTLQVIDLGAVKTTQEVPLGDGASPWSLALRGDGSVAVTLQGTGELALVDPGVATADALLERVAMPTGAALEPYAGMNPLARPQGVAALPDGRLLVTLTNLDENFAPAAPGMLVEIIKRP